MAKNFYGRVQNKRDTSANWTAANPVLLDGEIIVVITDSGEVRHKTGDGIKTYTQLPFDDEVVRNLVSNKQDKLTFDAEPTEGSANPVTSGGVYTALNDYNPTFIVEYGVTTHADMVSAYTDGKTLVCMKDNLLYQLVTYNESGAIMFSRAYGDNIDYIRESNNNWTLVEKELETKLTFDEVPTDGSENPVTSDGVYNLDHVIEQNVGAVQKFWRGTKAEYDAIEVKDETVMYIITDDDGSGGASIPEVTASDEGKFLRVVGGAPAWATVQSAEEVSF